MPNRRVEYQADAITAAAGLQVAEHGLRGLSLRKVAARAGSSRGGVTYRAGRKSDLISNLIADSLQFQQVRHRRWLELTARLDVSSPQVLAAVIDAFLDEAVTISRAQSLVLCELVTEAARRKQRDTDLAKLVRAEEAFWRDLQQQAADAANFGWAIANYCRDELPFALALHGQPEYHLVRSATIARLVSRIAPVKKQGFGVGFDPAVATDSDDADSLDGVRRSREIDRAVASLIHQDGVANVTHRSVAAAANIPKSTIAHHFRTREALLKAGLAEIYRQLIDADRSLLLAKDRLPEMTLSIASHSIALEATRDASLIPSTLSLRTRRGEFIIHSLTTMLGPGRTDWVAIQAMGMIMVGAGLGLHLAGGEIMGPMTLLERLVFGEGASVKRKTGAPRSSHEPRRPR